MNSAQQWPVLEQCREREDSLKGLNLARIRGVLATAASMFLDLFLKRVRFVQGHRTARGAQHARKQEYALEIAAIGDSLTTGFYVSSPLAMIWRARTAARRNWFLDTSGSIDSMFERLGRTLPVTAYQYATVSARVDRGARRTLADYLIAAQHFSAQVTSIRRLARFPDVVLVWIGHNNLDWVKAVSINDQSLTTLALEKLTAEFIESFRGQLSRLIEGAARADHPAAIVVFALVDFRLFFSAREKAERIRTESVSRYPRLSDDYLYFASLRPEHRGGMIRLAAMINDALWQLVEMLCTKPSFPQQVVLRFSKALHDTDISSEVTLSDVDAWHPSLVGHRLLAASAYEPIARIIASLNCTGTMSP